MSSMGATLVNKYVLSVLKFTYPTVYQSWQMGVAFIALVSSSFLGLTQFSAIERFSVREWLPAICFFMLGIYSGSVALSRLPIPVFFTFFHLVYVECAVADSVFFKKSQSTSSLFGLALGFVGLMFSVSYQPFDFLGYKWMNIHCVSSASYTIFVRRFYKGSMGELDKILLNSSFSMVVLLSLGAFSGEFAHSLEFPYLYTRNFHHGCIISGTTGALLGLSYSKLSDLMLVSKLRWISSLSMVITSLISLVLFPSFKPPMLGILSIAVTLCGSVIHTYSVWNGESRLERKEDIEDTVLT